MLGDSRFPVELRRWIFRWATYVPGALETKIESQLEMERRRYDSTSYADSLSTKKALLFVCKSWLSIAIELLYEDIRPTSKLRLRALIGALRSSRVASHAQGHGWWTKRLHIPITSDPANFQPTLDVIRFTPNLSILTFVHGGAMEIRLGLDALDIVSQIFALVAPKLRYLESYVHIPSFESEYLRLPYLETLAAICTPLGQPHSYQYLSALTLFCWNKLQVDHLSFPALRHLSLTYIFPLHISSILQFLDRHGNDLESLSIHTFTGPDWARDPSSTSITDMQFLARCPHLQEIIFHGGINATATEKILYPSVTRIGVTFGRPTGTSLRCHYGLDRFPNLLCVRVINTAYLGPSDDITDFWGSFEDRGNIRFEDAEGELVPLFQGLPIIFKPLPP